VGVRIHLDTDLGSDPDDACALAMLLGWPGVDLVGITTTIDPGGRRAGYVRYCLSLAGRDDIPLEAGAEISLTTGRRADPVAAHWPAEATPRPSRPGAALDLLQQTIAAGATLVGIGPSTNLAELERARSGLLRHVPVVVMGGWLRPPAPGLPEWGPERDSNVQWDTRAAELVFRATDRLTLVTLPATLRAHLRAADLPRLRASGPLGELLARQSEAHSADSGKRDLPRTCPALPPDFLNFHYDPVTCAVALGWGGAVVEDVRLRTVFVRDTLRFELHAEGRPTRVVTDVDGASFSETWLTAVEAAQK
jgi:inosine-uridine nucleoside N-ribohydrolase